MNLNAAQILIAEAFLQNITLRSRASFLMILMFIPNIFVLYPFFAMISKKGRYFARRYLPVEYWAKERWADFWRPFFNLVELRINL
jgi:hypothetical protein